MKNKIYKVIAFTFMIFSIINSVNAQSKTGTTIGQFLKIEPSSRMAALGNAGVSLSGEATASYYNPASLGRLTSTDIQFTFNKWLADITYNYAIAALYIENLGTFSLQSTMLNSGEIDVRTVERPLGTGEKYEVRNFALGLGYGLMLTDRVSVGFQINYLNESIWHSNLSGFSLNFGVQYQIGVEGPIIGASVSNFGTWSSYDGRDLFIDYDHDPDKYGDNDGLPAQLRTDSYQLPTTYRVGISFPIELGDSYKLLIATDAMHPNDNSESINLGTELNLFDMISLRGGYRNLFLPDLEGGLVLGLGIKAKIPAVPYFRLDYAYADYGRLSEAHRITVSLSF